MDVLGIVLSLFLLMFMAYMGFSVILFAPVFALLAASLQGMPIMPSSRNSLWPKPWST